MEEIKKSWQTTATGSLADWKLSPCPSSRLREISLLQSREKCQHPKHLTKGERTPCWQCLDKDCSQGGGGSPGLKSGDFYSSPARSTVVLCYLG